jgi:hypothetical protein
MKDLIVGRFMLGFGFYMTLVVVASFAFHVISTRVRAPRHLYTLFGPTLALFTHMGFFLFAQQSFLLIPWLLLGAASPRFRKVSCLGFTLCWLGIGWYMHTLF